MHFSSLKLFAPNGHMFIFFIGHLFYKIYENKLIIKQHCLYTLIVQ